MSKSSSLNEAKSSRGRSRSPLKDQPLRNPGQSVEEERRRLIEDKLEQPLLVALFVTIWAAYEWWRYYTSQPPRPVLFTVAAVCVIGFAAWRITRALPQLRSLRLAAEGEKAVGQFLEGLRERGYRVFHDVVGDGFNLDHVLIGPAGVFTVETKTWSKPKGDLRIHFDGESIRRGELEPDRNPAIQARAQARWLKNLLSESTGRSLDVRPVVVFPGWFVEQPVAAHREVWVLNPRALPRFLENEPTRMDEDDVRLASFHLSRFVRACEAAQNSV